MLIPSMLLIRSQIYFEENAINHLVIGGPRSTAVERDEGRHNLLQPMIGYYLKMLPLSVLLLGVAAKDPVNSSTGYAIK